jgi:hypothetical protein
MNMPWSCDSSVMKVEKLKLTRGEYIGESIFPGGEYAGE